MSDFQKVKETIVVTALYYGRNDLSPPVLAMMAEDLKGFDPNAVIAAYGAYRRNGKNRTFPLPSQIIEMLEGGNSRSNANELVTKLIAAVKSRGEPWARFASKFYKTGSFQSDFLEELGPVAWNVVQLHGGWILFCESYWASDRNETAFKAQLREFIEGQMEKQRMGELIALPDRRPAGALPDPIDLFKSLPYEKSRRES